MGRLCWKNYGKPIPGEFAISIWACGQRSKMKRRFSKGIRHLALKVNNLEEMQKFYVDILGFEIEWQPDPQNLYITSGSDNLALHEVAENVTPGALDHLGILVE